VVLHFARSISVTWSTSPLQITRETFDFDQSLLAEDDIEDHGPFNFHETDTQHFLAKILVLQCELAIELTDVLAELYPQNGFNMLVPSWHTDLTAWLFELL